MSSSGSATTTTAPALAPAGPVTLVTQTRVLPDRTEDFRTWQQQINDVVQVYPGFLDREVLPPSPEQPDWVIIQRFDGIDSARAWLASPQRAELLTHVQSWLVGSDDIHIVTGDQGAAPAPVSAVVSARVLPGQEQVFRAWHEKLVAALAEQPGYQGNKLEPPIAGVQDDWTTIVRFDSEPRLQAWLASPAQKALMAEAAAFTADTHTRVIRTGFDAWFQFGGQETSPPPAWKQSMLVLLGLYPTVALFGLLVTTPLLVGGFGWPFFLTLFIGNTASTLLLNKIVPWLSQRFNWWLNPAPNDVQRVNVIGIGIIVACYGLLLFLFSRLI